MFTEYDKNWEISEEEFNKQCAEEITEEYNLLEEDKKDNDYKFCYWR